MNNLNYEKILSRADELYSEKCGYKTNVHSRQLKAVLQALIEEINNQKHDLISDPNQLEN